MITHDTFAVEVELGSLKVYYVWEKPTRWDIMESKRYDWHDARCEESIGPFPSLNEAMQDYASTKALEKTCKRVKVMQQLQKKERRNPHGITKIISRYQF